jgi:regulator of protease activity HflC (stomatin/prohibitin superfamily)
MSIIRRFLLPVVLLIACTGCEQLGSTEYAIRFWKLPAPVGGVSDNVFQPGETVVDVPVLTELYRFDTSVRDVTWGEKQKGKEEKSEGLGYVQTRAKDGNEVALAVTISYKLMADPEKLVKLIQKVGGSSHAVEKLVITAARSDLRTRMNELETSQSIDKKARYGAVDKVRTSLSERLAPLGIHIHRVILNDFEFRRIRADGSFDSSYEERLKEIQEREEDIQRERERIKTIEAKKREELNIMQAKVNQMVERAKGFELQAQARGGGYLKAKTNESEAILETGKAYAEGLTEQINALSGPGGKAILKLELAKQLIEHNPSFVVMNSQQSDGIEVKRVDANELLDQIGVLEGLRAGSRKAPQTVESKNVLTPAESLTPKD